MRKKLLILITAFIGLTTMHSLVAQTYDPLAVQRINDLIANNGLQATPDAPETWYFAVWNDEMPKQIIEVNLSFMQSMQLMPLVGDASFAGLTTLQTLNYARNYYLMLNSLDVTDCTQLRTLNLYESVIRKIYATGCTQLQTLDCGFNEMLAELDVIGCTQLHTLKCYLGNLTELDVTSCIQLQHLWCGDNYLSELDVTNCTQLISLYCDYNYLAELDVTNCTQLISLYCNDNSLTNLYLAELKNLTNFRGFSQRVWLTLYENEANTYSHSIILNAPTFGNTAIGYEEGILKSTDNTVRETLFTVQTNEPSYELSGTMNFTYSNIGISSPNKMPLKVYPNPTTGILFVECENFNTIRLYDIFGKEVLNQQGNGKTAININHLPKGVYVVSVFLECKAMGNVKIVKL